MFKVNNIVLVSASRKIGTLERRSGNFNTHFTLLGTASIIL